MGMSFKEMIELSNQLLREAAAILENPESGGEDRTKADSMVGEAKELRERATQLKEILELGIEQAMTEAEENNVPDADRQKSNPEHPSQFKDWGSYLQAVHVACRSQSPHRDSRLVWFRDEKEAGMQPADQKTMVESSGASGGFLVPAEFYAQLQAVQGEVGIVRPRATIIRMRRRQVNIPVLDQTGTTAGQPHWFGGLIFYWAEEAAAKTASDAAFREVALVAHKLIGYTRASDELVDDAAISLGDFLSGPLGFAGGVAWMEDYAFIQGSGAGQPQGVITAGATITVPRQAVANPVQYTDLVNMLESFLPSANGGWVVNQSVMSNLLLMMDQAGGAANTGTYIWGSAVDGVPSRLLGYPLRFTEKNPVVGTAGDIILADWRYYVIGDRQAATIESTQYDYWRYDQTSWRVVHRVDGQPWLSAPLTLQDGTLQVSPFVILGDKST